MLSGVIGLDGPGAWSLFESMRYHRFVNVSSL